MDILASREYNPGEIGMDIVHTHCASLDVHNKTFVPTIIVPDPKGGLHKETRTFGTITGPVRRVGGTRHHPCGYEEDRRVLEPGLQHFGAQFRGGVGECPTYQGGSWAQGGCERFGMDSRTLAAWLAQGQLCSSGGAARIA